MPSSLRLCRVTRENSSDLAEYAREFADAGESYLALPENDPEALIAISYPAGQADVYLKEALEQQLADTFVFVDGTKATELFDRVGWDDFDGMSGTSPGSLPPSDFTTKFDELYEAEYGEKFQQPFVHEAYDAVMAIALAAEKAGSVDLTAIRDALQDIGNAPGTLVGSPPQGIADALTAIGNGEDVDYSGASGSVEWDDNGDVTLGTIDTWHVDAATKKFVTDKSFKVDLTAGTVEEITAGAIGLDSTIDRVFRLDPVLDRARRGYS